MHIRARIAAIAGLTVVSLAADCNTTPEPTPPPGSWLVLLCKASNMPAEPQQAPFYEATFSRDSAELLWQYFNEMSGGTVDVSGSRVRGWFTMATDSATLAVRTRTTTPSRVQTAQDCRSAAAVGLANQGIGVDMEDYAGIISVINMPVDVGQAGRGNAVVAGHFENDISAVEHEMLHVLGLPHSLTPPNDVGVDHIFAFDTLAAPYKDCWDMMSYAGCAYSFTTARHGEQGPGLHAANLEKLGWIDASRVFAPGAASVQQTVMLAPVSERSKPGILLARVEVPAGNYVIEYRKPSGFDRAFLSPGVIIREERGVNRITYLVTRSTDAVEWKQGDVFTDSRNFLRIAVTGLTLDFANVEINTGWSPTGPPVAEGGVCGHKSTGQVSPCAAGLRCVQPRNNQTWSVDYFCRP